jgi:hypothetical protein
MLENPFYHNEDAKAERGFLRKAWAILGAVCFFILFAIAATWPTKAHADPRFQVEADGAKVVLYDDKCAVAAVANLPYKATWEEKGKVFQGCWGARPDAGVVMFYFDDKSVGLIPISGLTPVVGV